MALYDFVSPGSFSVDLRSGIKAQARSGRDTLPCTRKLRYTRASFSLGLKVPVIFQNGWIAPISGVASERVCACTLRSSFVFFGIL